MLIQRLAPDEISTDLPLELAREVGWRALVKLGFGGVLIDREQNLVWGARGSGLASRDEVATIYFESNGARTLIIAASFSIVAGARMGRARRRARKIADAIENSLRLRPSFPVEPGEPKAETPDLIAPIAAPTGESSYFNSAPVYGAAAPVKRGNLVMVYALVGLILVHLLSPVAWIYANRTLNYYGDFDPGDGAKVRAGRVIAIVGTLILAAIWAFYGWSIFGSVD